jgi:hypothetical protein
MGGDKGSIIGEDGERATHGPPVIAEAKVEYRQGIPGEDVVSAAPGVSRLAGDGSGSLPRLRFAAAPRQQGNLVDPRLAAGARIPGCRRDRACLCEAGFCSREPASGNLGHRAPKAERDREQRQRPAIAGQLHPAAAQGVHSVLVRKFEGGEGARPEPAQPLVRTQVVGTEHADGATQQRHGRRVTGSYPRRESGQQQVGYRPLQRAIALHRLRRAGDLGHSFAAWRPAGVQRCEEGLKQGLAGKSLVDRLKRTRGGEQDRRRLARLPGCQPDTAAQLCRLSTRQRIIEPRRSLLEEVFCPIGRTRRKVGLRGSQQPTCSQVLVGGEQGGSRSQMDAGKADLAQCPRPAIITQRDWYFRA